MKTRIEITKYHHLSPALLTELGSLADLEFGHIPIVKETTWAEPDWTCLLYINQHLASFYHIVNRKVLFDKKAIQIIGIHNLITTKLYRGKGYAKYLLKESQSFWRDNLEASHALLFCADALIPFYSQLQWKLCMCPVYFSQSAERRIWPSNTMIYNLSNDLLPMEIDICGLPW